MTVPRRSTAPVNITWRSVKITRQRTGSTRATEAWCASSTSQAHTLTTPLAFETKPFHSVELTEQPYWEYPLATGNPTTHTMRLPERRAGHHVLLAVWEVGDTGNALYQVIDLQFT
ncbi:lytic polysaccharide monooxygenase [Streptomyces sp. NPDC005423]|uniref:lytic polysaccharide monooxygenase n=1 Tax=Streptomyces sp. NPDC005423 TaxID=3155343 RepID=UPI0033B07CCF